MRCIFSLNHQALMNPIVWFGFANLGLLLGPVITTAMETPVVRRNAGCFPYGISVACSGSH